MNIRKQLSYLLQQSGKTLQKTDLMKIKIEGAECDLLEHLIQFGIMLWIKNIQIQFQDFVPEAERCMQEIQADLAHTRELTYQYSSVWVNWKLKEQF